MTEKQKILIDLLREMFQLNQSDLDFGIYRIMNAKSEEITTFLEKDLIGSISEAFASNGNDALKKELEDKINSFKNDGFTDEQIDNNAKIKELRTKLSSSTDSASMVNDIFSHLTTFFSRYYKDGDFVSLRRYKKNTYAIPYEGEEVKLHWANSDQYYIKTSEYFRDYTFKIEEKTIHFKLIDADTEKNNNKASDDKERRFVLHEEIPTEIKDDEFFIYFEYKAVGKENQDKLNEKATDSILKSSGIEEWKTLLEIKAPTEKNKNRTLLEKHLKSYTSRNSFDYFIHKDLRGFLQRELDFYIKNEILFLDDIEEASATKIEESLNKIKTLKSIAKKIIAFLSQLEEFQKSLWLKKKFIIDTNYCITLDRIDEIYYEEILGCTEQLDKWNTLFGVKVASLEELKNEPYLVLDTKFFDTKFKNKLLGEFEDLDDTIDGVLINSENFGALNLLQERYKELIKTAYIDPPYNTGNDGFPYLDRYQHSSWMTMMDSRISAIKNLLSVTGHIMCSIDEIELSRLRELLMHILGEENYLGELIWQGSSKNDQKYVSFSHEYMLIAFKNKLAMDNTSIRWLERKQGLDDIYAAYKKISKEHPDDYSEQTQKLKDWYKNLKDSHPAKQWSHYAVVEERGIYFPDNISKPAKGYFYDVIHPLTSKVCKPPKGGYRFIETTMVEQLEKKLIHFGKDETTVPCRKSFLHETEYGTPRSVIYQDGRAATKRIENLFGDKNVFSNPKDQNVLRRLFSISIQENAVILDPFAGSGTTIESLLDMRRYDSINHKYIAIEMGEYFEAVTKPRILKAIYTNNWKDGKPLDKKGISHVFKYFKLESYEDTLSNLAFKRTKKQQGTLDENPILKKDYLLNYMLNYESNESQLNIDNFSNPFDYKLNIATGSAGETKEAVVDLVETFNYLIGLKIKSRQFIKEFLVVEGENLKGEKILIIWREGNDNEALNSFFTKMDFSVYDREFDTIYVNGDNNLANLKKDEDHFKVKLIEEEFKLRMFNNAGGI